MDLQASSPHPPPERARKRRAINACTNCRVSKVKCDGVRPSCDRCKRNEVQCDYAESVKDSLVSRVEGLEAEVRTIKAAMYNVQTQLSNLPSDKANSSATELSTLGTLTVQDRRGPVVSSEAIISVTPSLPFMHIRDEQISFGDHAAAKGLVTWDQASSWFRRHATPHLIFFAGSHNFVPIFCPSVDTIESVSTRSAFLFDCIVSIGCRAEEGFKSPVFRQLQMRLREHLSNALIYTPDTPKLEVIQAITILASYSENGYVLIAMALRFAMKMGLSDAADDLLGKMSRRSTACDAEDRELYRMTRVWYGICNLELFFSLDGGRMPSIKLQTSPRRIRALVNHRESSSADIRLLSQVELNIIRSNAYEPIISQHSATMLDREATLRRIVSDTSVELSLWLEEWTGIASARFASQPRSLALLNLRIQYEWAIITLHLKALSDCGIENVALMDDFQQDMVRTAKDAATQHLRYLLQVSSPPAQDVGQSEQYDEFHPAYLATFKWAMDYVWAKCAFSVLLVLKLALLLRDPPSVLTALFRDAHQVLEELKKITVGHISYFQILQVSIEKCEGALKDHIAQRYSSNGSNSNELNVELGHEEETQAERDFEGYVPSEFVFEWDFPGLNLKYIPLGWQDLFTDFDNVF